MESKNNSNCKDKKNPSSKATVISVQSRKGGIGKTTVALALAKHLINKEPDSAVLVIDLDIYGTCIVNAIKNRKVFSDVKVIKQCREDKWNGLPFANLLLLLKDAFDKGTIPEFIKGKNHLYTEPESKLGIFVLGSDDHFDNEPYNVQNDDSIKLISASLLFDIFNRRLFIRFIEKIIDSFVQYATITNTPKEKALERAAKCYVILDNSPGYVGYLYELESWLLARGPKVSKFLYVASSNTNDLIEIACVMHEYRFRMLSKLLAKLCNFEHIDNNTPLAPVDVEKTIYKYFSSMESNIPNTNKIFTSNLVASVMREISDTFAVAFNMDGIDIDYIDSCIRNHYLYSACLINMVNPELKVGKHIIKDNMKITDIIRRPFSQDRDTLPNMDTLIYNMVPFNELYKWPYLNEKLSKPEDIRETYKSWYRNSGLRIFPYHMYSKEIDKSNDTKSVSIGYSYYLRMIHYFQRISWRHIDLLNSLATRGYTQLTRTIPDNWRVLQIPDEFMQSICQELEVSAVDLHDFEYVPSRRIREFFKDHKDSKRNEDIWYIDSSQPVYLIAFKTIIIRLIDSNLDNISMFTDYFDRYYDFVSNISKEKLQDGRISKLEAHYTKQTTKEIHLPDDTIAIYLNRLGIDNGIEKQVLVKLLHSLVNSYDYWYSYMLLVGDMMNALYLSCSTADGELFVPLEYYRLGNEMFVDNTLSFNDFREQLNNIAKGKGPSTLHYFEYVLKYITEYWW